MTKKQIGSSKNIEMLGLDDPPLLKIAQLKIQFVFIQPNFVNNLSDFTNFGELRNFLGCRGSAGGGGGGKRKSAPGRQKPSLRL